jgi:hypothetical protein
MRIHLTAVSANAKTGPIPVSTSSADTCPTSCALRGNGCYAESGNLAIHWKHVSNGARGADLATFARSIQALPAGQLWRHNQAGDLPGQGDTIDHGALGELVRANKGRRGFTYTHKPLTRENRACIRGANKHGFTVNVSCDNLAAADKAKRANVGPVVVVVPSDAPERSKTPAGHTVLVCPVQTGRTESCATCKLCAWSGRDVIIGFRAHGARAKTVDRLIQIGAKTK